VLLGVSSSCHRPHLFCCSLSLYGLLFVPTCREGEWVRERGIELCELTTSRYYCFGWSTIILVFFLVRTDLYVPMRLMPEFIVLKSLCLVFFFDKKTDYFFVIDLINCLYLSDSLAFKKFNPIILVFALIKGLLSSPFFLARGFNN
jgi:hypothetical protein